MSKERSPNYPGRNLGDAIQDASTLYEKEGRTAFVGAVAAKALGYKSFSGPSKVRLAAMKQYGLLDQKGKGELQLSERALTLILMNASHSEWKNAVRAAAMAPPIFNELYRDKLSASDESITHTLVVDKHFTADGAANCIRVWRATMEFSHLDGHAEKVLQDTFNSVSMSGQNKDQLVRENDGKNQELQIGDYVQWCSQGVDQFPIPMRIAGFYDDGAYAYVEGSQTGLPISELEKRYDPEQPIVPSRGTAQEHESLRDAGGQTMAARMTSPQTGQQIGAAIPVTPDCSISIMAVGQVTQGAIDNLVKYLELFKGSFPKTTSDDHQNE